MKTKKNKEKIQVLNGYGFGFILENDVSVEIMLFEEHKHRWKFSKVYREFENEPRKHLEKPDLVVNYTLWVDYELGVCEEIKLGMNVIWPKRRGKEYAFGMDITPNTQKYFDFQYEKRTRENIPYFRLKSLQVGADRIDFDDLSAKSSSAIMEPIEFPIPLLDHINLEGGSYNIPFLIAREKTSDFTFPENIRK